MINVSSVVKNPWIRVHSANNPQLARENGGPFRRFGGAGEEREMADLLGGRASNSTPEGHYTPATAAPQRGSEPALIDEAAVRRFGGLGRTGSVQ